MEKLSKVKEALKKCGISRVKVSGSSITLPKRVFSIELMNQLRRYGWAEDDFNVAYGGHSCSIKMSKDDTHISISDYHDKVVVRIN